MFTFTLQKGNIGDDLARFVDRIANPGSGQKRAISDAIRRGFQDNITSQSSGEGKWDPLAPRTVASRSALGWGPTGPILVRRGVLRDTWVNAGGQGHVSTVQRSGGTTTYEEGASGMIPAVHEFGAVVDIPAMQQSRKNGMMNVGGARSVTIPARPISILNEKSEQRIVDVIEFVIAQLEHEVMGR